MRVKVFFVAIFTIILLTVEGFPITDHNAFYSIQSYTASFLPKASFLSPTIPLTSFKLYNPPYGYYLLLIVLIAFATELIFKWRTRRNRKLRYALEVKVGEKTNDYRRLNRRLQENIQKLKDLTESQEEIIRVRREMISIYAHDIRGPLHFIKLISEKTSNNLNSLSFNTVEEHLKVINESSSGILNQTEKMFTWNRAHDDDLPIAFKWISLEDVIVDEVKPLKSLAKAKNTEINYQVSSDIVLHTEADLLRIVINNLVQNAIKYTEDGSILISSKVGIDAVYLIVEDSGVGMSDEQLTKVRTGINKSVKGTKQETGKAFGLRMVRDILKRLNATLDMCSKLGDGTTVYIEFKVGETSQTNQTELHSESN